MNVVRIVGVGVDALRLHLREIGLVGGRRHLVGLQRVEVAPDAEVDVRRHVDQVAGRKVLGRQPVGVGLRTLRLVRRLDGVDVEMDRADMVGVRLQHALQRGDQVGRPPGRRLAAIRPVVPGRQVHQRLGVERGDVEIVRKALRDLLHRVGIGDVERDAVGGLVRRRSAWRARRSAPAPSRSHWAPAAAPR